MKFQTSRPTAIIQPSWQVCVCAAVAAFLIVSSGRCAATADTLATESTPALTGAEPYAISPGDQLDISVLGHDEMHALVTVLPDGTFTYPIAGTVRAAGSTIADLEKVVAQALSVQLNQPEVTITVAQRQVDQISVIGAVTSPGKINFKVGWHVLDAIAACGGLSVPGPNFASASLIRNGTSAFPIDLVRMMGDSPDSTQNIALQPGDVLLITAREQSQVDAQVLGEVATPGFVRVPKDGSLNTVLVEAGGPTPRALLSHAEIERDGTTIPIDLRNYVTLGQVPDNVKIEAGDVLVIPRNQNEFAVFGDVSTPGYDMFPDSDQPLTVLKALGVAGAQSADANLSDVTVVRPVVGNVKTATTFNVDVADVLKNGDVAKDMVLQPGDIVYVQSRKQHMSAGQVLQFLNPLVDLAAIARL